MEYILVIAGFRQTLRPIIERSDQVTTFGTYIIDWGLAPTASTSPNEKYYDGHMAVFPWVCHTTIV